MSSASCQNLAFSRVRWPSAILAVSAAPGHPCPVPHLFMDPLAMQPSAPWGWTSPALMPFPGSFLKRSLALAPVLDSLIETFILH